MTGVIEARAEQAGVTYEEMEKTCLDRVSLRRMVTAEDVAGMVAFLISAAGRILRPIARRRRKCRGAVTQPGRRTVSP